MSSVLSVEIRIQRIVRRLTFAENAKVLAQPEVRWAGLYRTPQQYAAQCESTCRTDDPHVWR